MAERTVVPRAFCFPVPSGLDDDRAAALPNPGVSAWLSLTQRAKLAPGETVLILGATGVIGQLAVQMAKLLGARRVIGAGRNERVLSMLSELGADATIQLDQPQDSLKDAFSRAAGDQGYDVIIDYLWGRPTEALLAAITGGTATFRWPCSAGSCSASTIRWRLSTADERRWRASRRGAGMSRRRHAA